jgi:hypothetical protein
LEVFSLRSIEAKQTAAIISLVTAPFVAVLMVVSSRISAEFTIVVFSIADSLKRPAESREA